jgi:membrane protein implicated in regulation of membrane protease activity
MNKKTFNIIIEIAYILMGMFCFGAGLFRGGLSSQFQWVFFALGLICFAMFGMRIFMRKNQEKRNNRNK